LFVIGYSLVLSQQEKYTETFLGFSNITSSDHVQ